MKAHGGSAAQLHSFLTSALDEWLTACRSRFIHGTTALLPTVSKAGWATGTVQTFCGNEKSPSFPRQFQSSSPQFSQYNDRAVLAKNVKSAVEFDDIKLIFLALRENKFPDLRLSETTLLHVQRSFLHCSVLLQFNFQLVSGVHKLSRIFGSCITLIHPYSGRKHDATLSCCYAHSIHSVNM